MNSAPLFHSPALLCLRERMVILLNMNAGAINMKQKPIYSISCTAFILITFLASACATNIPVKSSMNDFVLMGLKTNRQVTVSYEVFSNIQDGKITVLREEGAGATGSVIINESAALKRMIDDYMFARFSKISDNSDIKIVITLQSFIVRDWSTESTGMVVLRAVVGSSAYSRMVSARIVAAIDVTQRGATETKTIIANSEETYIGEFTSPNGNKAFSDCVNSANNKLLMQLNAFFEDRKI